MLKKLVILSFISWVLLPVVLLSQTKTPFSGDPAKYKDELTTFMGPNLNDVQKANLIKWDSLAFNKEDMTRIIDLTSQFYGRGMRPVPHFNDLLVTLNTFIISKSESDILGSWLTGLSEIVFNPRLNNESIDRYVKNTSLMIKSNILAETSSIRWKVKDSKLKFLHDTVFYVEIKNATLTCYS